jgi:hypothetical protein
MGMTTTTDTTVSQSTETESERSRRVRAWVCAGTIAATLPYLALKIAWLSGSRIGVHGDDMDSGAMAGANALTLGMDAIAALIALALARPWGLRIPAWLLVFPMWVATGFLTPIVVSAPLEALAASLSGSGPTHAQNADQIAGWVYAVVYSGFGVQGIGLLLGFVLHARARWGWAFTLRLHDLPQGTVFRTHRVIISGVAAFSMIPALWHLFWAAGGAAGRPGDERSWLIRLVTDGAFGLLLLAGAAGMLVLAWRRDARPARAALVGAWLGTGTMFSWGMWWQLAAAISTPLTAGDDLRGLALLGGAQMLAGAVLATVLGLTVVASVPGAQAADLDMPRAKIRV